MHLTSSLCHSLSKKKKIDESNTIKEERGVGKGAGTLEKRVWYSDSQLELKKKFVKQDSQSSRKHIEVPVVPAEGMQSALSLDQKNPSVCTFLSLLLK